MDLYYHETTVVNDNGITIELNNLDYDGHIREYGSLNLTQKKVQLRDGNVMDLMNGS